MTKTAQPVRLIAFLRGINVGGRHKVPMAELKSTLAAMGFSDIQTLLNSGNAVFTSERTDIPALEREIAQTLEKTFGFPIPVLVRTMADVQALITRDPFKNIEVHQDTRLYVTFLRDDVEDRLTIPWTSPDGSLKILSATDKILLTVLDISKSKTTEAMRLLERYYPTDLTTRNWNTVVKLNDLA